jgi:hypothetical protein
VESRDHRRRLRKFERQLTPNVNAHMRPYVPTAAMRADPFIAA